MFGWHNEVCNNRDSCEEGTTHQFPNIGKRVRVRRDRDLELRMVSTDYYATIKGKYAVADIKYDSHEAILKVGSDQYWVDVEEDIRLGFAGKAHALMNPSTSIHSGETMLNKIKKTTKSTTDFVSRHRVGLAVTATAVTAAYVHIKVVANVNEFLEAKGLLDEFYHLDEI